jgi:hypothetical protein
MESKHMPSILGMITMPVLIIQEVTRHSGSGGEHQEVGRGDEGKEAELQVQRDCWRRSR